MKFDNQLRYAIRMLGEYQHELPLQHWLRDYYKINKQMGSKDRKLLSEIMYVYFRLGDAIRDVPVVDRILTGLFLCSNSSNDFLGYFRPEWNDKINWKMKEKLTLCRASGIKIQLEAIFPWTSLLSEGIECNEFLSSFLVQPDLFFRIRPGKTELVRGRLDSLSLEYVFTEPSTIRINNGTQVEKLFVPDQDIVIQDLNSQLTLVRSENIIREVAGNQFEAWDCCCGSGGKSILLHDLFPEVTLTVSDKRVSILKNLDRRFRTAGISNYHAAVEDLAGSANKTKTARKYDLILADLPCTGSGTWSRNPESIFFFDEDHIDKYANLQKKIIDQILPRLKNGGLLVYITCSVFKKENEDQISYILKNADMTLEFYELLGGYLSKADSLFVSVLRKQ